MYLSPREKGNKMAEIMIEETRYLVTDGWEVFRLADSKKQAAEIAEDEAHECGQVEIYELKQVGCAYIPDPNPVVEWDE
jgi:hypothetical protein